ncbi:MAG: hypothetical protein AAF353_09880 [Pseudomonadota bacterium]
MPNKLTSAFVLLMIFAGSAPVVSAAGLATLFTTPQEREIINSNRYKSEAVTAPVEEVQAEQEVESAVQQLVQEEVTQQYRISGITISSEGPHSVWINSLVYEDSESLEDGSKIKVIAGDEIRVRITAPDGKHHYATSGEIIDVTYLAPIEN